MSENRQQMNTIACTKLDNISHITWLKRSDSPRKPRGHNFHPSKLVKTKTSKFHNAEEKKRNVTLKN